MWRRFDKNGCITPEFEKGVIEFLDFAYMQHNIVHHDQIRCPCSKCCNKQYLTRNEVHFHLKKNGFERGYTVCLHTGNLIGVPHRLHKAKPSTKNPQDVMEVLV